jgi:hypothetical protein
MTSVEPPPSRTYQVVDDIEGEFAERVVEAFHYRPDELFRVMLTGGDVAQRCYERLASHAETQIDWWLVDVWTSDAGLARRTLLNHVGAAYAVHHLVDEAPTGPQERVDVMHLDLGPDGELSGPVPLGWTSALILVTACGAACASPLADIRAGADVPVNRLAGRSVVVLADRAAAAMARA